MSMREWIPRKRRIYIRWSIWHRDVGWLGIRRTAPLDRLQQLRPGGSHEMGVRTGVLEIQGPTLAQGTWDGRRAVFVLFAIFWDSL